MALGLFLVLGFSALGGLLGFVFERIEHEMGGAEVLPQTVLELKLKDGLVEHPSDDPLERLNIDRLEMSESLGLDALLEVLDRAGRDDQVAGICVEVLGSTGSFSQSSELRSALDQWKSKGKWVAAYSETYGFKEYHLASVADEVVMSPLGDVELKGLGLEMMFMGNMMKALGVDVQIFRGENNLYKSAVEPFTRRNLSEENREQLEAYVHSVWSSLKTDIETSRALKAGDLDRFVNDALPRSSQQSVDLKLVDRLRYRHQWRAEVAARIGEDDPKDVAWMSCLQYAKAKKIHPLQAPSSLKEPGIAVMLAEGVILADERDDGRSITPSWVGSWLDHLLENEDVAALVLRIDSPGGEALASESIWRDLKRFSEQKPLVVSMGSVVASGGYYMACAANVIVAEPTGLTGSIGVYGMLPQVEGFLNQNLKIEVDHVYTHPRVGGSGFYRPLSQVAKDDLLRGVDQVYRTFKQRVSQGRDMSLDEVELVARGRIWSGADAQRVGLVDRLGGLDLAIELAREQAKLPAWAPVVYTRGGHEWMRWMESLRGDKKAATLARRGGVITHLAEDVLGVDRGWLELIQGLKQSEFGVQARLPFVWQIKD